MSAPLNDHYFHPATPSKWCVDVILGELALKYGCKFESASGNWLKRIVTQSGDVFPIHSRDLGLNSSSATAFISDKSATSSALDRIPHIEHLVFHRPGNGDYHAIRSKMADYAKTHEYNVVCKPNNGFGGRNVHHVTTLDNLHQKAQLIFDLRKDVAICPFEKIEDEYRVVVLLNRVELIYKKVRPFVTGDGKSNLQKLIEAHPSKLEPTKDLPLPLDVIPPEGEVVWLTWKHNSCKGAQSVVVETNKAPNGMIELAIAASKAVRLTFGTIDIVQITGKNLQVIEINETVSWGLYEEEKEELSYQKIKAVYEKAFCHLLQIEQR